jgi:hypothetical protein
LRTDPSSGDELLLGKRAHRRGKATEANHEA